MAALISTFQRYARIIHEDIQTVFDRDPAARSVMEIIFGHPGFHAIFMQRVAHWIWQWKLFVREYGSLNCLKRVFHAEEEI